MSSTPYIALYPSDYLADTAHLGLLEHGIYWRLLLHYYQHGKPLPADTDRLARIINAMTPEEKRTLEFILPEYFILQNKDDGSRVWVHNRAEREIYAASERIEKMHNRGVAGAIGRWGKPKENANAMLEECLSIASQNQNQNHIKESAARSSIGQPILASSDAAPSAKASPKDKTNPCPYEEIRKLWAKNFPSLAQPYEPEKWSDQRRRLVRERWKEQPDLEWWDSFLEYLASSDFLMGRKNGRDFQITFDWLIKTANWVKCQEGNYHG